MHWLLTGLFLAIVLWFLAGGLSRPERMYQLPFLAGAMAFSFIAPQLPGVASDSFVPSSAYTKTMCMAVLCMLMLRLGWSKSQEYPAAPQRIFSERRLVITAAFFSAVGAIFYQKLSSLPGDISVGVQMTGMPVIYLFFARLLSYGLAISLLCFARRPNAITGAIIAFGMLFYLERILITGKRAEAIELALMVLLAFWFQRRWIAPRSIIITGILVGTTLMSSMSDYRQITRANSGPIWTDVANINLVANFEQLLKTGGPEMRNAVQMIDQIDRNLEFDYGKIHWNTLVHNYIPAQLVGSSIKDAFKLSTPQPGRDYQPLTGTTSTGFVDAFQSFWYFGALKFFILSFAICTFWKSAIAGGTMAQLFYMLSIVPAMHSVSHATDWVLQVWVHMTLFLVPALIFSMTPIKSPSQSSIDGSARPTRPVFSSGGGT